MGLHLNLVPLIGEMVRSHGLRGSVCTLGIQDVPFGFEELEQVLQTPLRGRGPPRAALPCSDAKDWLGLSVIARPTTIGLLLDSFI